MAVSKITYQISYNQPNNYKDSHALRYDRSRFFFTVLIPAYIERSPIFRIRNAYVYMYYAIFFIKNHFKKIKLVLKNSTILILYYNSQTIRNVKKVFRVLQKLFLFKDMILFHA